MKYDFKCDACGSEFEVDMPHTEFPKARKEGVPCVKCAEVARFNFNPSGVQISFAGDAWADKNYAEKEYRKRRSVYMKDRMYKNHVKPELVPNFEGERAASWEEARDAAVDAGKSGASYEPLIKRERLRK